MEKRNFLKKNKDLFLGIAIATVIFVPILFLGPKEAPDSIVLNPDVYNNAQKRCEKMRTQLRDKRIHSLNKILGDSICDKKQKFMVFAYSGFDCHNCVDEGFEISKKIDSVFPIQRIYIIASNANISRDQQRNDYKNFIYNDKKELVRRELKYFYTPVLLSFDTSGYIADVCYPGIDNKSVKEKCMSRFIKVSRMKIK